MKTIVITGASRGLGLILAKEFDSNDWGVVATGRSERPEGLAETIKYAQFDAADSSACESFWQRLKADVQNDSICLVNNAGSYVSGGLLDTQPEDYAGQMQSNYFAAVYMTQSLAKFISSARIINIISTSALAAHAGNSAYGAAKAAEMHFFQSLQKEFVPEKYQITNLYPSDIATHGPNPKAISPEDLAGFIRELAEASKTYYLKDVTLFPTN